MDQLRRWLPVLLGLLQAMSFACSTANIRPQYASYEPTTEGIPSVSVDVALERLERSRLFWKLAFVKEPRIGRWTYGPAIQRHTYTLKAPQYSYVRAFYASETQVNFTYVVIEGGQVVLRGLSSVDPDQFVKIKGKDRRGVSRILREEWIESEGEIGVHEEGAPPLLMDELYAQCATEIRRTNVGPIRLYFHPSGVLMHCGRTFADCPHCTTVSIHAYATHSIRPWAREFKVPDWSCVDYWGLVLLGAPSWMRGFDVACSPPSFKVKTIQTFDDGSSGQICQIDPSACPVVNTFPILSYGTNSSRAYAWQYPSKLGYLDVGKADPDEQLRAVGPEGVIRVVKDGDQKGISIGWSKKTLDMLEETDVRLR